MEIIRNQQELWQELPSLVEVSQPENRPAPPTLWRIGNKSLFETNNRVRRRANKRLSLSRRTSAPQLKEENSEHDEEEEEVKREEECEDDNESDDDSLPQLTDSDSEGEEEDEDDYDSDDDSLPDLVSASEDEEDYDDEGIADCDTFISMENLLVLLGRFGLNDHQD